MLDKFADELRQQREKAGLSLQQMATKTRIDLKFLEAIDQGNFSFLPDLYVKAFVKQFAKTIGLDENMTIKKFEAAREGKEIDPNPPAPVEEIKQVEDPKVEAPKTETPRTETPKPTIISTTPLKSYVDEQKQKTSDDESKANSQLIIFGLGGIGLIIIAALLYFFVFNKSDKIVVEETPIDEVIEQNNQRYVEEEPIEQIVSDSTIVPVSSDSLYLTFYAKETSWVFVVLDNNRTQEFTLTPNSKFSITAAREFKATVGNSGGVTLQLDNKDVDFTGRAGSVRHFKLDKTGIVYLNAPPKLEQ
jgi:cytoskeletal protein RodZ